MSVSPLSEAAPPIEVSSITDEEPLVELLPSEEEPLVELVLVLLSDVKFSGLSCSALLLTQPVSVAAIAPTRREIKIFFIYFPFLVQTYS